MTAALGTVVVVPFEDSFTLIVMVVLVVLVVREVPEDRVVLAWC